MIGRPTKPPPPPRTQSLDQKFSEISKPVRPPPPKSVNLKPLQSRYTNIKTSSNAYENIGKYSQLFVLRINFFPI